MLRFARCQFFLPQLFAISLLAACAADPKIAGDDGDYKITPVTPVLVSELQREQFDQSHNTDTAPPVSEKPYNYLLGAGDILYAKFYTPSNMGFDGNADSSRPLSNNWQEYNEVIIKDDGTVSFPYIGELHFADLTLSEAKQSLDNALARYFKNPQSVLQVKDFKSRSVQLTGQFLKPGAQFLRFVPLRILEAINTGGGLTDAADLANAAITHKDGKVEKIDLFALINNGDQRQNRILFDGDTLHVPANYGNKVFVMGEVRNPSVQYIKAGHMTVMEALNAPIGISTPGGLNPMTASYAQIYVVRGVIDDRMLNAPVKDAAETPVPPFVDDTVTPLPSPLKTSIYQLDSSTGNGLAMAAQFPLRPNDVVYVSPTAVSEWSKIITQLIPYNATYAGNSAHNW